MTVGQVFTLEMPWKRPPLNHNQRMHPVVKASVVAEIRRDVGWVAKAAKIPRAERITVQLHYAPGRRGRRDPMNITATSKPAIDGITDAGVVIDDDSEHVTELPPQIHWPPVPGPRCWITVEVNA